MNDGSSIERKAGRIKQVVPDGAQTYMMEKKTPALTVDEQNVRDNQASAFYTHIENRIRQFESELLENQCLGLQIASIGNDSAFTVTNVRCFNPSLIAFSGTKATGEKVELIQHVSQISIMLIAIARDGDSIQKTPVGFQMPKTDSKDQMSPPDNDT